MKSSARIAKLLVTARRGKRLSLVKVSEDTNISLNLLKDLERGSPTGLPTAYEQGILRSYSEYLGLAISPRRTNTRQDRHRFNKLSFFTVSDLGLRTFFSLLLVMLGGYLVWQTLQLVLPPRLSLISPLTDTVSSNRKYEIKGHSRPDVQIYINSDQVFVDDDGSFVYPVLLHQGLNSFEVTALNSLGRKTTLTRAVILLPTD